MHILLLYAVTCDLPAQVLHHPVIVDSGSQESPHREGQFITFTCPSGFLLTGPNASVCTGNGIWEPDPGEVDCIGDYAHKGALILYHIIIIIQLTAEYHLWTEMSHQTTVLLWRVLF
jgi:hypothetical protein